MGGGGCKGRRVCERERREVAEKVSQRQGAITQTTRKTNNKQRSNLQPAHAGDVLAVGLQVLADLLDARAQARDLHLGAAAVAVVALERRHGGEVDVLLVLERRAVFRCVCSIEGR